MQIRVIVTCVLALVVAAHGRGLFDVDDLDRSVRPVDDFFLFVNGRWLNRTTIPPSQTATGSIFGMRYENYFKLKRIMDDLISTDRSGVHLPAHSVQRRLADLYSAGLDEQAIERAGIEPIRETLLDLQRVETYQQLIGFLQKWYTETNLGLLFDIAVHADRRNSSVNAAYWKQAGITLPERDYYFRSDQQSKRIRVNYVQYIDRLLALSNSILNTTTRLADAEDILALETRLAASHRTPYEANDPELNYHRYNLTQLVQTMPNLDWPRMLSFLNIESESMVIAQPDYYLLLNELIDSQPLRTWKNKVRFTLVHQMSPYLSKNFVDARFHVFNRLIYGQAEKKAPWMEIIDFIDRHLGELLGQLFVSEYFSSKSKERMMDLTTNLIETYRKRIRRSTWLSNSTKAKVSKKLRSINTKIGYPSKWRSYDGVSINRDSYFDSIISVFQAACRKSIEDLRKEVDRSEWVVPPQIVNAFYDPSLNEITFPAAILQAPFFSADADDALNYGGIGYAIGHELTHGFDNHGRKYDEKGNLCHWWTDEEIKTFDARTRILIEQYNAYRFFNVSVNGNLTLGENIADLSGLEVAYEAFSNTKQAKEGVTIDGFTPQQRFFLAVGRDWRAKMTDERVLFNLKQDPHAPVMARINGPLSNMLSFYRAFNVSKGDGMYREPEDRAVIW